ncbi:MAG: ABC transporter ATP-binding protein [Thermoleophilia bacterium]|nr:ABC transporter ATP-binding protein [Thermoleophilia bacterium]
MTTPTHVANPDTVEMRGVSRRFGDIPAVRGTDLTIPAGQTVALLGPNGAGKSTMIDILLGLTRPDAGTVRVFGHVPSEAIRRGWVGAMLQSGTPLHDLSVREYLTMLAGLYPHPLSVERAMDIAGVAALADRRTQRLSGGESQRVRCAAAVICDPRLLVLDEPTVAMDVESRRAFWDAMRAFAAQGRTVLFATHYLEEADAFADRVVLMARGRVVADGPATQIKARVGGRTLRFTLPPGRDADVASLPGVTAVTRHGDALTATCADSDAAVRALVARVPEARDIEISGARLEDAFIELTTNEEVPA